MVQFLLADAVANGGQMKITASDIIFVVLLILILFPFMFWLIRFARSSRANINKSLEQNEELLKHVSRICDRAESNERHAVAIEGKLDQIIDQLKRRPLS